MPPALILALGVLGVSSASLLVRLAAEAPPFVIGAYRLAIASAVVVPLALFSRGQARAPVPHAWRLALLSGLFLAVHLAAWIASLSYTTVASSTVLVTTTPVMLALMPSAWRGDPLSRRARAGVLIAFAGAAVIAAGDAGIELGMALGDGLALLGAAAMVGHRLTGRRLLRAGLRPMTYLALAYPLAGMLLASTALAAGQPLAGFSPNTYAALAAMGLVPQLIGHSAFNWALSRVSAVAVSTAVTGEPVGATLLALVFLNEVPRATTLAGAVLVLAGTYLVLREEHA